jgi:signal transduction histidine kinase
LPRTYKWIGVSSADALQTQGDAVLNPPPEIETVVFELLRTNKETGMGIGLWLSKTIVDSHQGTLSFTTRVNHGTRFLITLPLTTTKMYY